MALVDVDRQEVLDLLPDYGLDEVLVRDVGITPPDDLEAADFRAEGCSRILLHALQQLDAVNPDRSFVFWKSRVSPVWMLREDDVIAREALTAITSGEASLIQASPKFVTDAISLASELIRHRRASDLGYDERFTHDWVRDNPIADSLLAARFTGVGEARNDSVVPQEVRRTAFMYVID